MGRYEATDPQAVRMETSIRARLTVPGLSRRENQWLLGGRRILGCGSEPLRQVFPMSRSYRVLEWTFFEQVIEAHSLSPLNPLIRRIDFAVLPGYSGDFVAPTILLPSTQTRPVAIFLTDLGPALPLGQRIYMSKFCAEEEDLS